MSVLTLILGHERKLMKTNTKIAKRVVSPFSVSGELATKKIGEELDLMSRL